MKRHFPPLNALRSFEATARLLSFQQAAAELNVTHSAVSHQIKKLEQDLGTALFSRLGRSIALTPVGEQYYVEIHAALLQIERSTLELFGEPDKGDLIVQAYMGVASRWLVPRVGSFRQQYPGIQIQLNNSYLGWGIDRDAVDVGIIYAEQVDNSLSYQRLFKGHLIPVCSPELLAAEGCQSLDQLLTQPFLNITESPDNLPHWLAAQQRSDDSITIVSEHDNHLLALEAAITGAGVAVMPVFFCCSDIASGKLVVPQPLLVPEIGDWYLVQQNANVANSRAICFSNWLLRELSQDVVLQQYL